MVLHGLVIRQGNVDGARNPSGWVLLWKGWYPSPIKWWGSGYSPFVSQNRLKARTQHKGCRGWERQRKPRTWAEPAETFSVKLSEFSCGNKDKCPSYSLWFSLPWELPLCESPSFPFSDLPIPGLIQTSAVRTGGRVYKAATLVFLLPCSALLGPWGSLDINSFVGGGNRGSCLYDKVEIYLKLNISTLPLCV